MSLKETIIFCDGACSGNPGPGGWGSIVIFQDEVVQELGAYQASTTNNQMEITAASNALKILSQKSQALVYTDSVYVIKGITQWIWGWKKNNWKTSQKEDVANKDLWIELDSIIFKNNLKIQWKYCRGHSGFAGNERVDEIAVAFSQQKYISLYQGPLKNYSQNIFPLPPDVPLPTSDFTNKKENSNAYYLSYVNGVLEEHKDWSSCEKKVKGVSGAKFKKINNPDERVKTLAGWGLKNI